MLNNEYEIFKRLNNRLKEEALDLTIICVGGFVLSHYGMRTTHDIDGFYESTEKINAIIKEVGDEFRINAADELWLNNSVENMNACPPEEICEVLYTFSNLKVLMPPLEYIAGMKFQSARGQDIEDIGAIIKKLQIRTPNDLIVVLQKYGFGDVDESLLLEAFGYAYGMEWLEKYYIENEEEIIKKIKQS